MNEDLKKTASSLWWDQADDGATEPWKPELSRKFFRLNQPLLLVHSDQGLEEACGGALFLSAETAPPRARPVAGLEPGCSLEMLGDQSFCSDHNIRYPYAVGSMANGISSTAMVEAASNAGLLGFFGAGGLGLAEIEDAVERLNSKLGNRPFGCNLIHSPNEPELERAAVELYLKKKVRLVEASAYIRLTPALIKYCVHGIYRDSEGKVRTPNRIVAKASRAEVAARFFSPPPEKMLRELVADGSITSEQAELAGETPVARDLTAEADSGGHTDNQSPLTLIPTMIALRDSFMDRYSYDRPLRVGAAGGIATPISALAAFSMGAAWIMTGSVNQCTREAGVSDMVRELLSKTRQADVVMAPAADMFEMGVKVQVVKWGTMFPMRAAKLYELYKTFNSLEDLPAPERDNLEKKFFRASLDEIWAQTRNYFQQRDPGQTARAEGDPKHRMALVFRWYLGQASSWANRGEVSRKMDFQIFCGPAMGAFNDWVKGSCLEHFENRDVVSVAMNLLFGAAVCKRIQSLKFQGVGTFNSDAIKPLPLDEIKEHLK